MFTIFLPAAIPFEQSEPEYSATYTAEHLHTLNSLQVSDPSQARWRQNF